MTPNIEWGRTVGAATLVLALGAGLLWQLTDGLQIFTSEAWRRAEIQKQPRPLPQMSLQDERGQVLELRSLCGQVLVMDFIYTRCPGVCKALGATSAKLAKEFAQAGQPVTVLSVSFDPLHDGPDQLAAFKKNQEPQPTPWRLVRPVHQADRTQLLAIAGVVVIPDGLGGFEHNAALHIVDKACRIHELVDMEDMDHAKRAVEALL